MYYFRNILCENLCETFLETLPKIWEIAFYLENEFRAITAIAIGTRVGVKLKGSDYESVGRRFESCQARQ
jgi:hypothetical protein